MRQGAAERLQIRLPRAATVCPREKTPSHVPERYEKIHHTLFGDLTQPGLLNMTRDNTKEIAKLRSDVKEMKTDVKTLLADKGHRSARIEGRKDVVIWGRVLIAVIIGVLTIGGSLGIWRVHQSFETIQRQIERIPAVPE